MQLEVHNASGQGTGRFVELPEDVFGIEPNTHVLYLSVKQYLAHQRQGTHKAKEKGEINASTRKLKRQKGTGGARAGSIKSPVFIGGGRVFGPRPRNYDMKLNKKVKRLARNSALSYLAKNDQIVVLEDFQFEKPKTKEYLTILKNLGVAGKKSLLVLGEVNNNVVLSARNIPRVGIATVEALNTYTILNGGKLILSESAVEKFSA